MDAANVQYHKMDIQRPGIIDIMTSPYATQPPFNIHILRAPRFFMFLISYAAVRRPNHHAVCMPNPGSMPTCLSAFAFLKSTSRFSAFCDAASARTSSSSANFAPRGASSRSRSTVAHMVTFSPRIVMTPGNLTSCISQRGTFESEEGVTSGFRAAIRS
jgi:hypothetical protein